MNAHRIALSLILLGLLAAGCSSEIKIGAVISESGAVASYGEKVKNGIDLALEEINAAGGFNGKPFVVIYKDDATIAARGQQVIQELIDEDVDAIIGAVSSEVTLAIAPLCVEEKVVLLSPSASAPSISDAGMWVYRNYPSDILEGTAMAKFVKEELGLERVAIFAQSSAFGQGLKEVFTRQYDGRFTEVVKVFDFEDGAVDSFPAMVAEIKQLKPDGIYLISYQDDLVELLKQFDAAGIKAVRMGSGSVTPDVARLAGKAARHLIYPQPVFDLASPEPAVSEFVNAYRTKYGEDRHSAVSWTRFVRANETTPTAMAELRYNNSAGLTALGIPVEVVPEEELITRETADPFPANHGFAQPPPN